MSNKNHEGYHDPTASEAIRRADRSRKVETCPGLEISERAALWDLERKEEYQKHLE